MKYDNDLTPIYSVKNVFFLFPTKHCQDLRLGFKSLKWLNQFVDDQTIIEKDSKYLEELPFYIRMTYDRLPQIQSTSRHGRRRGTLHPHKQYPNMAYRRMQ